MYALGFADTAIQVGPDPETGQQVIRIQDTRRGAYLARALGTDEPLASAGFFTLPHDHQLDARLCDLIDTLIAARYAHPRLLQLHLFDPEAL